MSTVAQIVIEVDADQANSQFKKLNSSASDISPTLQKMGSTSNSVMKGMAEDHKRAIENTRLLSESLGLRVPRALQNVIASSESTCSPLSTLFSVGIVVAFAAEAIRLINSIRQEISRFSEADRLGARLFKLDSANRERFHAALKEEQGLSLQAQLATASDIQKVQLKLAADLKEIDKDLESARVTGGTKAAEEIAKVRKLREQVAAADITEINRKLGEDTRRMAEQATLASLTGTDQILEKARQEVAQQKVLLDRKAIDIATFEQRRVALAATAQAEIIKMQHDAAAQGALDVLNAEAAGLHGTDQIEAERLAHLRQITAEEENLHIELAQKRKAVEIDYDNKIVALRRQATEETVKLDEEAAVAILPPWKRSYAQIAMDTQDKLRQIQQKLKDTTITSEEAAQQSAAVWQINFAKTRDQLAGDLQSLFDDVTSGNIGKRFKKMFEDMVFQMVATWILGMGQMRSASSTAITGGAGLLIKSLALGGGAKGALTGAAGGALIGSIIPGIGTLLGAGIGALIGLIGGLFGQHKGDKARIQVMEPLIAQIKVIRDSYDVFQTDYNTGVSELEALRAQSIASLKQIGGRQVTGNTSGTNKLVDDAESYLKTTEAERARRAQLQFGPAQFHSGGFVDPSLAGVPSWWGGIRMHIGGEVPAILETGEHVINRSTVNRVGRGTLDRMNAGGSGGETHNHCYNITAVDAKSFADLLDRGGMVEIVTGLRRGRMAGAG